MLNIGLSLSDGKTGGSELLFKLMILSLKKLQKIAYLQQINYNILF